MGKYDELLEQVDALIVKDDWIISNMANTASAIFDGMDALNWAGFYIVREGILQVGPFIGLPACVKIKPGDGVCGTAMVLKKTMLINDVHTFPGHIACDEASNSEIVVPIIVKGEVVAVLDIDSPYLNRFRADEQLFFESVGRKIEKVWEEIG
ncbi:MAG: GAF domain-containing protein [Clostridia bacterium]|jgi:GAF domain-containing protein|nr:GAF domain-containing protein [Clostridia bacterium]MBR6134974.1 GAF domain-containing protein [Clostridia bacterium]